MTGNVKDNKRIACYGDSLAVIEKGKIIKRGIILSSNNPNFKPYMLHAHKR